MGFFTMKDRIEMLQRDISVAYNSVKYRHRCNQANRRLEKSWKEMAESGRFYGDEYDVIVGLEEDLINPESIYELIAKAIVQCGVCDIKNREQEQKRDGYVRDHSIREIIRFIYEAIIYCQDDSLELIDEDEIDDWICLMKRAHSWRVLRDFDTYFPGKISLTGLAKEINGILYQCYPDFDQKCIENGCEEDEKLPFTNYISEELLAETGAVLVRLVEEKYGDPDGGDDSDDEYDDIQEIDTNSHPRNARGINELLRE